MYRDMINAIVFALYCILFFVCIEILLRKLTVHDILKWIILDTHAKDLLKEPTIKIESIK